MWGTGLSLFPEPKFPNMGLSDEVARKLPYLFQELGFRQTWHEDYPYNRAGVVDLRSDGIGLRFERDGLAICVQVAAPSEPDEWLGLSWVLEAIRGEPAAAFPGCGELESLGSLVRHCACPLD